MEDRKRGLRLKLRWSLALCCVAFLWIAGYFGGRDAGLRSGREEGFSAGRLEGIDDGLAFIDDTQRCYQEVFEVHSVLADRLERMPVDQRSEQAFVEEMASLIDELYAEIAPDTEPASDVNFTIHGFPTNRSLVVRAKPMKMAQLAMYLDDKDAYFAWKASSDRFAR